MRFTLKICICTVLIVAILFAIAGHVLIAQSFNAALSFRVEKALADYTSMASSMEAELYGLMLYYNTVTPLMYAEVLQRASSVQQGETSCALYDENKRYLVSVGDAVFEQELTFTHLARNRFVYRLVRLQRADGNNVAVLDTAGSVVIGGTTYYLSIRYDAEDLMMLRNEQIRSTVLLHCITVGITYVTMLLISYFMSRSVRSLNNFARRIQGGHYDQRARVASLDEIGDLTVSFNNMAGAIEQKVTKLEGYAKQQKDFVASFSHELKTPMTSIIGYADMLRSSEMDPEDAFTAANFIFTEGKRLESLSLKLMDMVVLDKNDYQLQRGYARRAIGHAVAVVTPMLEKNGLTLEASAEQQIILYEKDLLLTLITNLVDNARKASEAGSTIELIGNKQDNRYRITVRDHGIGIPDEELHRITEAFYMVDKSRARAQHGAGLGLAICNKIAQLHGSELHFESQLGVGTSVWFDLPLYHDKRSKGGGDS